MNYTMPEWILLIGAIGLQAQGVISSWKSNAKLGAIATSVQEGKNEMYSIAKTAEVTLGHVNSAATKATVEREALIAERATLRATIEDMKKTAALLAQALAVSQTYDRRQAADPNGPLPMTIKDEDLPITIDKEKKPKK